MTVDEVKLSQVEAQAVVRRLLAVGYEVPLVDDRSERFSVQVSKDVKERLAVIGRLFGYSLARSADVVLAVGLSAVEDAIVAAWEDAHGSE